MINLLPISEKVKRAQEKQFKIILIIGILVIAGLIVVILSFLSIKFYLYNQIELQEVLIDIKSKGSENVKELEGKVTDINEILLGFNQFYNDQVALSVFLDSFSDLLISGITLETFSYNHEQAVITGIASDLETAHEFREVLKKSFKEVDFVLPDWLQQGEINFKVIFK